jgi:hypothetical protein
MPERQKRGILPPILKETKKALWTFVSMREGLQLHLLYRLQVFETMGNSLDRNRLRLRKTSTASSVLD